MGFNGRYLSSGTLSLTGIHHPSCCNRGPSRRVLSESDPIANSTFRAAVMGGGRRLAETRYCSRSNGYRTSILGTIDATAAGHGMIVSARMDEEHTITSEADIPDSIRWRNEYVGCSCGFKADMSEQPWTGWGGPESNEDHKTVLQYSGGVDPGSLTCDMCASELDMRNESEPKVDLEGRKVFIRHCHILSLCRDSPPSRSAPNLKACCTAQAVKNGRAVERWQPCVYWLDQPWTLKSFRRRVVSFIIASS
jgi:hypothetical protein